MACSAAPLLVTTVVGLLLGAGVSGPMGSVYRFAFDHLPLFEAMREQQKWVGLALLGYAVAFGAAVEWVAVRTRSAFAIAAACAPLVVAPTLVWGLGGSVSTSEYPTGWQEADAAMGRGTGLALFLPWHAYQPFSFSDYRTIATPANAFFGRTVLTSDAVELPGLRTDSTSLRTAYVDRLVADGGGGAFGRLVAPLGVEYVVLAKTPELLNYSWVADQPDLELVMDTETMAVYRVAPRGTGRVVTNWLADYPAAVDAAQSGRLGSQAVLPGSTEGRPSRAEESGALTRQSPTAWRGEPGSAGWVVIPEEYSEGWQIDGRPGVPTLAGTVAMEVGPEATTVEYAPWRFLRPATLASLGVLGLLIIGGLIEHRHAFSRRRAP